MFLRSLSEEADPVLVLTPGGDMAKKPATSEVFDLCSIKHQRGSP